MDISLEMEKQKSCRSCQMTLKTEREKMLAVETYNSLDPDLDTEHRKTGELLRWNEIILNIDTGLAAHWAGK